MPRAKRYHITGYIWHITHRCHKCEFLLKFARDRRKWISWLFEAKKRYGLSILNFNVTSNHIHLLVFDTGDSTTIARSMQLIAGRTAQEFNQRKNRNGAFWQDRYHATAVESGRHLRQCIVYIDMNMVRADVVTHPAEWEFGGYQEIQTPKQRYSLIDRKRLYFATGSGNGDQFRAAHLSWIEEELRKNFQKRESHWTESLAVGSQSFVEKVKETLGFKAKSRQIYPSKSGAGSELRDRVTAYNADLGLKNDGLSQNIGYFWNQNI